MNFQIGNMFACICLLLFHPLLSHFLNILGVTLFRIIHHQNYSPKVYCPIWAFKRAIYLQQAQTVLLQNMTSCFRITFFSKLVYNWLISSYKKHLQFFYLNMFETLRSSFQIIHLKYIIQNYSCLYSISDLSVLFL